MDNVSIFQLLTAQLRILWLYLQRPTVQVQLTAVVLTLLVAGMFTQLLRWIVRRYLVPDVVAYVEETEIAPTSPDTPALPPSTTFSSQARRWLYAIQPLFFPIITLI